MNLNDVKERLAEEKAKTEALLAELYLLDPSLKKHDFEVKRLVIEMRDARPEIKLEHTFRDHLRDHLFFRAGAIMANKGAPKKPHGLMFWTMSFVPVGVAVAVVLMFVVPKYYGGGVILPIPTGGGPAIDTTAPENGTMLKQGDTDSSILQRDNLPEGTVSILNPRPGIEVGVSVLMPQAGYVTLYSYKNGMAAQPLGVSRLLPPGPSDNVHVLLSRPLVEGEAIYAELRASNGDMRYEDATDPVIFGRNGSPVSVIATVSR